MENKLIVGIITVMVLATAACFGPASEVVATKPDPLSKPEVIANKPDQLPSLEVVIFKANPSKIESGMTLKLQWEVKGADSVIIDNGVGMVQSTGSLDVKPAAITAYNLTASNAGGTIVSSVIINVQPVVKTTSPASAPPNLPKGLLPALRANESYVFYGDAVMVGADDHYIILRNNPVAHSPTWAELKSFLQSDQTDRRAYVTGKFTCGDFAEMLHNNAEAAGIRAAIVAVELKPSYMMEGVINHSLDAFDTADRGLIYIDATSSAQGFYADKVVNVVVGNEYEPVAIFPQPGQMQNWPGMGKIAAIDLFQW